MRITARIASGVDSGIVLAPFTGIHSISEELCTNGELDEAKCRKRLDLPGIQIGSDDRIQVFAFASELLKGIENASDNLLKKNGGAINSTDTAHAERKLEKGKYVFVRTDLRYRENGRFISLRINVDNPKGLVGPVEETARSYALIIARVANDIRRQLQENGSSWKYDFSGGPGYPDLFIDAKRVSKDLTPDS